jgi:prepilin-type N-terminal cleavage/methylation domain-containing protein
MMIYSFQSRAASRSVPRPRRGLSLIEMMVAVMILGITMTFVGHISTGIAQSNRKSDIVAKRTFAMQQQANVVGALPFASLTSTVLPATKNFRLGDFSYTRRIGLTTAGTTSIGQTAVITITIVPQTGIPSDTLLSESLTMYRSSPICGTTLGMVSC